MSVFRAIRTETRALAGRTALVENSRSITYETLLTSAEALATTLRAKGVAPGDRVALVCEDGIDYVVLSLALLCLPAAIVPLGTTLHDPEVEAAAERMEAAHVIDARPGARAGTAVPLPGGEATPYLRHRVPANAARRLTGTGIEAFIRFSSGTTGESKGVLLTHETILARTDAANEALGVSSDDTVLWVLSMSHHFVVSILLFLRRGATIVVCRPPLLESMRNGLRDHDVTVTYAAPFHYQLATAADAFPSTAFDCVRLPISTAMSLPRAAAERFEAKFRRRLAGAYGIIEVGLPFVDADTAGRRTGTVGRKLPAYDVRIDGPDDEGNGEILVRGPGMFDAYVSPWRARDDVLDDGWFRTGDVGRIEEDGRLVIAGRRKTVINFAGMKVFPGVVEEILDAHPDVVEALVYGQPHATFGDLPAARVVLREGADPAPAPAALRAWCRERLEAYEVPSDIEIVASLPRTASDKLLRH